MKPEKIEAKVFNTGKIYRTSGGYEAKYIILSSVLFAILEITIASIIFFILTALSLYLFLNNK